MTEFENDTQFTNLIAVTLQRHPDWFPAAISGLTRGFSECLAIASMKLAEAKVAPFELGKLIPGKGIFMGQWEPKDRDGKPIGQKFNVFAAPTDLTGADGERACLTYNDAVKAVGQLRNWHGHDGWMIENDTALYKVLESGDGIGKWFIPPRELLCGKDVDGNVVRGEHLYKLRNEGDFKGTFVPTTKGDSSTDYPSYYWSCSELRDYHTHVWATRLPAGGVDWDHKDLLRFSSRPCRVELAL
jgi:hypothetical protein